MKLAGTVIGADPGNPFSDDDVQNVLQGLFADGALPTAGGNDLYMVIPPASYGNTANPGGGYHSYRG